MQKKIFVDSTLFLNSIEPTALKQKEAVLRLFRQAEAGKINLITNTTTIWEVADRLGKIKTKTDTHKYSRTHIHSIINSISDARFIEIVGVNPVFQAMHFYDDDKMNIKLGDAFISAWMIENKVPIIYAFDKHFKRVHTIVAKNPLFDGIILGKSEPHFLDTNIFLMAIQPTIPEHTRVSLKLFQAGADGLARLITNELVVLEMVYVMESLKKSKQEIRSNLLAITQSVEMFGAFSRSTLPVNAYNSTIVDALRLYEQFNVNIDIAMNAAWMLAHEIDSIYTFHTDYGRIPTLTPLTPQ